MWLIGACAGVAVVIVLLVIVLYAQSKDETQRQKDPSIMYIYNTHSHDGPGLYERSKGGQRPFGENSRTRRSEREKARGDHSFY